MHIHIVQGGDWEQYRAIRLAALKDAPSAFAATWQQEASYPAGRWQERAQLSAQGETRTIAVAVEGTGCWVGLAGGYRPGDWGADAELISMWVAPGHRGRGIGRALVSAVLSWAANHQARVIGLWVNKANLPAISLYGRAGFRPTGDIDRLPSDPDQEEIRMVREMGSRLNH